MRSAVWEQALEAGCILWKAGTDTMGIGSVPPLSRMCRRFAFRRWSIWEDALTAAIKGCGACSRNVDFDGDEKGG